MLLPGGFKHRAPFFFYLSLFAVVLIGVSASVYIYRMVDHAGREHILDRARTLAEATPVEELQTLAGDESDLKKESYTHLKQLLMNVNGVNRDSRFIYLIGKNSTGELFFYVDSEDPSSEDYSPPGQIYGEATPAMRELFEDGIPTVEGPDHDRWGTWISAYAPVRGESGAIIALLGIDLPAERFLADLTVYSFLPLVIAFSLFLLIIAAELFRRRELANLEQKDEFLSIASHEIRTPLSGVSWGLAQLLKKKEALSAEDRALVTLMHQNTLSLTARLNNLLDVHTLEHKKEKEFKKEVVGIDALFKEISLTLSLAARERDVTLMIPLMGASALRADRQMLYHVFYNLLGNAIKYTRPHTTVSVSYGYDEGVHTFEVHDEGEGIPDGERHSIFNGYWRGAAARSSGVAGTGLGLYMAKKAIQMHGGTIGFTSKAGRGTTFTVKIPD